MARLYAGFRYVKTQDGTPPAMAWYPMGAGTYYEGQVLRISATTGYAALQAATGTTCLGVLAADAVSIAAGTKVPVLLADSKNIFEAVRLATGAPQPLMNDLVGIAVASTNNYRVSSTATTAVIRIVGVNPDDDSGVTAGKRYWVKFDKSVWNGTSKVPAG